MRLSEFVDEQCHKGNEVRLPKTTSSVRTNEKQVKSKVSKTFCVPFQSSYLCIAI